MVFVLVDDEGDAIMDCLYAKKLGETALTQHINHWCSGESIHEDQWLYYLKMMEIKQKLNSEECLLK